MADSASSRLVHGARTAAAVLALAAGLTAVQVALACALAPGRGFPECYRSLSHWDCGWYETIVDVGYFSDEQGGPDHQGSVAFFPAHPVAAWLLSRATGLAARDSVQLASQLACVGFWAYLLLFLRRWGVSGWAAAAAVVLVASHPAAFYLVTGYSESLFLMSTLGFFYWAGTGSRAGLVLAALHGFVMTSSRLVGAPLVVVPLLQQWLEAAPGEAPWRRVRRLAPLGLAAGFAACGALAYFAYCQWRFGHWDAYMINARAGWECAPDYWAFFHAQTYLPARPRLEHGWVIPQWFDRLCVPCVFGLFAAFGVVEWRAARRAADTGWRWRAGLYAAVLVLFYLSVAGRSSLWMAGLIRYAHTFVVLFVLAGAHVVSRVGPPSRRVTAGLAVAAAAWVGVGLATQVAFLWRFTHGYWVA